MRWGFNPQPSAIRKLHINVIRAGNMVYGVISLIYPDLASIIYVAYVQSDALFPCLYLTLWAMPLSVPGLIIVTPSSMAYQNPVWLHFNLSLMRLLV